MLLCPSLVGIAQSMLELWSIEMLTEICLDFFKEKEITLQIWLSNVGDGQLSDGRPS